LLIYKTTIASWLQNNEMLAFRSQCHIFRFGNTKEV